MPVTAIDVLYFHYHICAWNSSCSKKEGIMAITEKPGTTTGNQVAGWLTPEEFSLLEDVCETLLPYEE